MKAERAGAASIKNRSLEIIEKSERRRKRTVILGLVVLTLVLVLGGGALWLFLRCDLGARPAAKATARRSTIRPPRTTWARRWSAAPASSAIWAGPG